MEKGFLSPKAGKKNATPGLGLRGMEKGSRKGTRIAGSVVNLADQVDIDVGELAARMKRIKGNGVEDQVVQPTKVLRTVDPQDNSGESNSVNDSCSAHNVSNVDESFTPNASKFIDTHVTTLIPEQVKPVSLDDAKELNGTQGADLGDVSQGADCEHIVNDNEGRGTA